MSSAPYDIVVGPAYVYVAPVGTSYPALDTQPAPPAAPASWSYLGRTDGGVKVAFNQTTKNLFVDQTILVVKVIRTEIMMEITMSLAETTLEHLSLVLDNVTIDTVAAGSGTRGYKQFALSAGVDLPHFAMIVRGPSPYMNDILQYNFATVVQTGKPDETFKRDAMSVVPNIWMALEDPNTAGQFGTLQAVNAAAM